LPNDLRPATRVARGATYLFLQGVLSTAVSVVYFMVLAHLFSGEEMGVYNILKMIVALVGALGTLALPSASTKYIAQYLAEDRRERASAVVTRMLQVSVMAGVVSFALILLLSGMMSKTLQRELEVFWIIAVIAFLTVLFPYVGSFLQGLQRIRELAVVQLAYPLAHLMTILLLYLGWGLLGVVYGWLTALLISCSTGLLLTARSLEVPEEPHPIGPLLRFSYPLYISGIVGLVSSWVDQLFLLRYVDLRFFGEYSIAVQAAAVPGLVSTSISTALFPQLTELHIRQGTDSLRQAFRLASRVVLVGFPTALLLAVCARPVIELFAGEGHLIAAEPLPILCLALLPGVVGIAISPALLTLERTKTVLALSVMPIVVNMAACYVALAPLQMKGLDSLRGVAWARVIASFVSFGSGLFALRRSLRVTLDLGVLWKTSAASGLMVAAIALLQRLTPQGLSSPYVLSGELALYAAVGGAVYFLSLIALRTIKKHDVELLRNYLPVKLRGMVAWLDRLVVAE